MVQTLPFNAVIKKVALRWVTSANVNKEKAFGAIWSSSQYIIFLHDLKKNKTIYWFFIDFSCFTNINYASEYYYLKGKVVHQWNLAFETTIRISHKSIDGILSFLKLIIQSSCRYFQLVQQCKMRKLNYLLCRIKKTCFTFKKINCLPWVGQIKEHKYVRIK